MKELDTKDMDKEEKELYQMLRSKFNTEEMERLTKLMIIDAEKYHQEQLKKNCVLVSGNAIADLNHISINAAMNIQGLTDNEPQVKEECGKIINAVRFFSKHYR